MEACLASCFARGTFSSRPCSHYSGVLCVCQGQRMQDRNGLGVALVSMVPSLNEKKSNQMQPPGIEPGSPAWQARILPLDHGCTLHVDRRAGATFVCSRGVLRRLYSMSRPLNACAAKLRTAADKADALREYQAAARQLRDALVESPQQQIVYLRRENAAMRREIAERAELIATHRERLRRWNQECVEVQTSSQLAAEVGR